MIIYFLKITSLLFGGIMIDFKLISLQRRPLEGSFTILRGIPSRKCRKIGPWCFFDKIQESHINESHYLHIGPHPHIGLQILSWLIEGEVQHQDSIGNKLIAGYDDLNFMTSGRGIVHTEDTPLGLLEKGNSALHLLQFWIALPKNYEMIDPDFTTMKQADLPIIDFYNGQGKLIVGNYDAKSSPLKTYSPIFAMEFTLAIGQIDLSLIAQYEYGITLIEGDVYFKDPKTNRSLHEKAITPESLLIFKGVEKLHIDVKSKARFIIFGGLPLEDEHYIWWNYVSSDPEQIRKSHELWESGDTSNFSKIEGEARDNLKAPEFPSKLISF